MIIANPDYKTIPLGHSAKTTRKAVAQSGDVSSLSIPTEVSVPQSVDAATTLLDDVGGLLSAGHWGTADASERTRCDTPVSTSVAEGGE